MKIKEFKAASEKYDILSVNEVIHAIGGGTPELIMEDNSCIIFGSHQLYDEMMSTSGYGDLFKKTFNVDILEKFKLAQDDVDPTHNTYRNKNVNELRLYNPAKGVIIDGTDTLSGLDIIRIFRENSGIIIP